LSFHDVDELDQPIRFVTNNPAIMPWLHDRDVPWTEFHLAPVILANALTSPEKHLDMESLAASATHDGLDVLRPPPAWFEGPAIECQSTGGNDTDAALLEGSAGFVRTPDSSEFAMKMSRQLTQPTAPR